jgi:hypothetical protein
MCCSYLFVRVVEWRVCTQDTTDVSITLSGVCSFFFFELLLQRRRAVRVKSEVERCEVQKKKVEKPTDFFLFIFLFVSCEICRCRVSLHIHTHIYIWKGCYDRFRVHFPRAGEEENPIISTYCFRHLSLFFFERDEGEERSGARLRAAHSCCFSRCCVITPRGGRVHFKTAVAVALFFWRGSTHAASAMCSRHHLRIREKRLGSSLVLPRGLRR